MALAHFDRLVAPLPGLRGEPPRCAHPTRLTVSAAVVSPMALLVARASTLRLLNLFNSPMREPEPNVLSPWKAVSPQASSGPGSFIRCLAGSELASRRRPGATPNETFAPQLGHFPRESKRRAEGLPGRVIHSSPTQDAEGAANLGRGRRPLGRGEPEARQLPLGTFGLRHPKIP